ncbi:MAG: hypothetical protein JJU10_05035 [Idiomarina sp.]|nr:hypothetical protein [Idiomarina sp.]
MNEPSYSDRKRIGGSPQAALSNSFKLDTGAILKEAWEKSQANRWPLLQGALVAFAIAFLVALVIFSFASEGSEETTMLLTLFVLQAIVVPPFIAALNVMGIQRSVGRDIKSSDVFMFWRNPWALLTANIFALIIVGIGQFLASVPILTMIWSLVFQAAFSFVLPLVAFDALGPFRAIHVSALVVFRRLLQFLLIYGVMLGLFLLALIPFGLGLIWIIPMFYTLKGILYREIFGVEADSVVVSESSNHDDSDNFTA